MSALLSRYHALPRAVRWLVLGALAVGAYFLAVEPVLDATASLTNKADAKLRQITAAAREDAGVRAAADTVKLGVQRFGLVTLPGAPKERSEALSRRVAQVLQAHNVRDVTSTVKDAPLNSVSLARELGSDVRIDRVLMELQFEASPETIVAVLADLERTPDVSAVSRVQVRKGAAAAGGTTSKSSSSRSAKATLAVEAWQLVKRGKAR